MKRTIEDKINKELEDLENHYSETRADFVYIIITRSFPIGYDKRKEYLLKLKQVDDKYHPVKYKYAGF